MADINQVKSEIIAALQHPEADEGLYFSNLFQLHEEDERPRVSGSPLEIGKALSELASEGKVTLDESGPETIVFLKS